MYNPEKISTLAIPGLSLKTISVVLLAIISLSQHLLAQVFDDFSDADFTTNPPWIGSADHFIINNLFQLQLNNSLAGSSYLSTALPLSSLDNLEWKFLVKQSFAASGANFGRVYLASDQSDLTIPLNGYYLQFGEAGSNDAVELFRQSGVTSVSVCKGNASGIAASFNVGIKIIRNDSGLWELFTDYAGGTDYELEASGTDSFHNTAAFFGVFASYTITNATRFYYDDFSIRSVTLPDTSPPEVVLMEVTSPAELTIVFSEKLDPISAQGLRNYFTSPTLGNPASVLIGKEEKTVTLRHSSPFKNGNTYSITIVDIADLAGNVMVPTTKEFLYFEPRPAHYKDIIITEFCADPSPVVGLPEAEFVEVYNRSEHPYDLSEWTLGDLSGFGKIPSYILLPGEYVIFASSVASTNFDLHGHALPVTSFRSLNNAADAIILKDPSGLTIDSLQYSASWYKDSEKADGGWSLELIDPRNICATAGNWAVSEAESGGTPGKQNSVNASLPDNTGPKLVAVVPTDVTTLSVMFDEKLENVIPLIEKFGIDPALEITEIAFGDPSLTTLILSLSDAIEPSKEYRLSVSDIHDCSGNRIQEQFSKTLFVLPEKASTGDIILNEILFNPRPTGVDFIEVYNRSYKTIDLKGWSIGTLGEGGIADPKKISTESLIIYPNDYMVFTENGNKLKGEYLSGIEEVFMEIDMPAFNDDAGSLTISDDQDMLIESFQYSDKMHAVFLKDNQGVSLERIALNGATSDSQNWRSANGDAGFATPGYVNSNSRNGGSLNDGSVIVEPEIFQPQIRSRDFTQIKYRFDQGGFVANIKILDSQGRAIKQLAHNELLGTEGFFRWDGDQDNGARARMGYYLVWFEIFDSAGMLKTFKKRVAIY